MKLRQYQSDIVEKGTEVLKKHGFLYLAMEVRTGKTLTSLAMSLALPVHNLLFITKKKAISNVDIPTIPVTDENKIVDILTKWWQKKYPMIEGQRNQNIYILAAAFNDFGVNQLVLSKGFYKKMDTT